MCPVDFHTLFLHFVDPVSYTHLLRRAPFTERTTTALTTSPFLTTPPGVASLTVATITSPMLAYLLVEPVSYTHLPL